MTDINDSELINAASQGAAAAVAAVQDEQLKESVLADSNVAANDAAMSAECAADSAAMAVDTSHEAASIAQFAAESAVNAGETAEVAAEVAFNAQSEIAAMRADFERGMEEHRASLQAMFDEFRPKQSEEPTEVTVNEHESGRHSASESTRDNAGSGGSDGNSSTRRHRFGTRR